jgi:glycosyltransferase involved in cell wall biosynthesis
MRVSVITPSYNQAQFVEETILSVLNQDYLDVEYIVMDGGSTDGTVDILEKYSDRITWKSEKDSGQSDAINKGLRVATGEIVAFLNSDDTYEPQAISRVAEFFQNNPEKKWVFGRCRIIDESGREIRKPITWYKNLLLRNYSYGKLLAENFISQPATFWRKELLSEIGYMNKTEHLLMDYEYWLRIGQRYCPGLLDEYLANFRFYAGSKTGSGFVKQLQNQMRLAQLYGAGHPVSVWLSKANYYKVAWTYKLLARFKR